MTRHDTAAAVRAWAGAAVARVDALPLTPGERYGVRPTHSLPELRALRVELRAELKARFGTSSYWPMLLPHLAALGEAASPPRGIPVRDVRVFARVARLRNALAALAAGRSISSDVEADNE